MTEFIAISALVIACLAYYRTVELDKAAVRITRQANEALRELERRIKSAAVNGQ